MSMPDFPDGVLDITCEQAFHMLLGSIAMEELALSHILNAEGEKLQYILGTLPGTPCPRASIQEVLEVNRSVGDLLEKVAYNQLLLKGKLQQVLEARGACCPPAPPCPPEPPCPPDPCLCVWSAERDALWSRGCPLSWKPSCAKGAAIAWQKCAPSALYLAPGRTYFTSASFSLRPHAPGPVRLVLREGGSGPVRAACEGLWTEGPALSLTCCALLPPAEGPARPLRFLLESPQSVTVEQAQWTVTSG